MTVAVDDREGVHLSAAAGLSISTPIIVTCRDRSHGHVQSTQTVVAVMPFKGGTAR